MATLVQLTMESPAIQYLCQKDKRLAKVIRQIGPLSYRPHRDNPFPYFIHEIIEQMLSTKASVRIYGRLETLCGGRVTPDGIAGLSLEEIRSIGTSATKAACIKRFSESVRTKEIDWERLSQLEEEAIVKELTKIKGIGMWTAKMYLIFTLDKPDVLPYEDGAFRQSYQWLYKTDDLSRASIEKKCRKWKPYSSIAARYLYEALDSGLTREEFHLFK